MKNPIFEFKNLQYNKNGANILNIKKFEIHRSACYLFNGNMASGKTLLLDILSKNNANYSVPLLSLCLTYKGSRGQPFLANPLIYMVGAEGFEPTTR